MNPLHEIEFDWLSGKVRVRSDDGRFTEIIGKVWGCAPSSAPGLLEYEADFARGRLVGPSGEASLDRRHALWHAYNLLMRDLMGSVRSHFVFHAAALAREDGALLLAGPSHFGKTTLAVHLALGGFALLADDLAVVERVSGNVAPVPRSLGVRAGSRATLTDAQLRLLAQAARDADGEDWAVDPNGVSATPSRPAPLGLVALLRSEEDGASTRVFHSHEIWLREGHESAVSEIRSLPGVTLVTSETAAPEILRVEVSDAAPLTRWLRKHEDRVLATVKIPARAPSFEGSPRIADIGPFQAALELSQEMLNRHPGSALAGEFAGRETHLLAEIAGLLGHARCVAFWPGRPDETVEALGAALRRSDDGAGSGGSHA